MAYAKAIVMEYWRPWSDNQNNPGLASVAKSRHLRSFTVMPMHAVLGELRNCVVAHADEAFEGRGVTLLGAHVVNDGADSGTLPRTFVPVKLVTGSSRSLWWINDRQHISELANHVGQCVSASAVRIKAALDTYSR